MSPGKKEGSNEEDAVANFREYLRIPSVQPNVNYGMLYSRVDVIIVCTYYREQILCVTRRISVYVCMSCILWRSGKVTFQVVTK